MNSWYMKYATMVFCGLTGLGAYQWVSWKDVDGQTWAAWVQAIGSIAAIIGAIWISNDQRRAANREQQDEKLLERTAAARSLVTLGYWALSTMERALGHGETDGAHGTSTFSTERLDHIRVLIEQVDGPADSFTSPIALMFINRLWEVKQNFIAVAHTELREYFIGQMNIHIQQTRLELYRLIDHKATLEAECRQRGIL